MKRRSASIAADGAAGGMAGSRRREPPVRRYLSPRLWLSSERLLPAALTGALCLLILYPLFWVVEVSFRTSIFDRTYTVEWYRKVFIDNGPATLDLLHQTVILAVGSTVLAVTIGVVAALLVARTDMPGRSAFTVVFLSPFFLTPMITAVSWALLASPRIGLYNDLLRWLFALEALTGPLDIYSMGGMVWVLGLYLSPYVYLFTSASLRSLDPSLEEAARMSGASAASTLVRITLPLVRPAILSSGLLVLIMAFGQWGVPAILGVPVRTYVLTTAIWSNMAAWPTQREYAAVLSVALLCAAFAFLWAQRRALGSRSFVTVTGRGFRPPSVTLARWRWPVAVAAWAFTILTGVMPFVALAYASVMSRWTTNLRFDLFTLRNYAGLGTIEPQAFPAIANSLGLSAAGATLTIALTFLVAFCIVRHRDVLARLLDYLAMLPLSIPSIVFAVGLLMAYLRPPLVLYGTPYILILAYVTLFIPVGVRAVASALVQVDPALEEAARMSGAGALRRIRAIILPLVRPGLVAGWVLIYVSLMKEVSSSILLGSPSVPVNATILWSLWSLGQYGAVASFEVLCTIAMAVVAAIVLGIGNRSAFRARSLS